MGLRLPHSVTARLRRTGAAAAALAALVLVGASLAVAAAPATANPFTGRSSRTAVVHFVPLDEGAAKLMRASLPALKAWIAAPVEITAIPGARPSWVSADRGQINGGAVIDDLVARFRQAQGARADLVFAVTTYSVFDVGSPQWAFVFGIRGGVGAPRGAIVGTAQMRAFHPERERARFVKMTLRYLGEIRCGLPRNDDPKSVLYANLLSDADLDRMAPRLPRRC